MKNFFKENFNPMYSQLLKAGSTLIGYDIGENCDPDGNTAGINAVWAVPSKDIDSITFDANGEVTAIALDAGIAWAKYTFEDDTAFFNQPYESQGVNLSVKQQLLFVLPKMSTETRDAAMSLLQCALCGLICVVRDNNGRMWVGGVRLFSTGDWTPKAFKPLGAAGAETQANSESDKNQITTQLESKNSEYARVFQGVEADLPTTVA